MRFGSLILLLLVLAALALPARAATGAEPFLPAGQTPAGKGPPAIPPTGTAQEPDLPGQQGQPEPQGQPAGQAGQEEAAQALAPDPAEQARQAAIQAALEAVLPPERALAAAGISDSRSIALGHEGSAPVYTVTRLAQGRLLGIFPIALETRSVLDARDGSVLREERPWQLFFVW